MNDEITMMQAHAIMDTIAERLSGMIGRTALALAEGNTSIDEIAERLTPDVNEMTRESFCEICDILDITKVIYPKTEMRG